MKYIWLIPLLPGIGAAVNGLVGIRSFSRKTAGWLATAMMMGALALSLAAFWQLLGLPGDARAFDINVLEWIPKIPLATHDGIGNFEVSWGFRLDPLAGMMILVVTGIGTLIHVYSIAYMVDEPRGGYARFFTYLNLFCFFMLMLVLGNNFLVMFVGWEGVGLCSYLLIGYWYEKKSASDAGKKAFITNRIGDWGFVLGVFLIYFTFGTFDFRAVQNAAALLPVETGQFGVISLICLLLFIGATGKSAQIPLYVWLPDAMEGPTPVSALIHAATMVTAGVYMLGRNAVLFSHAPEVMTIVAIVGVLTALMAASIGLVQYDIKRVLAYSTVSQLGYMFTAIGVGAFSAGAFHLMTHAFFKALLFLGSGSVIHAMAGEQDMRRMGALKKHMPVTFVTMFIGTLAIAGIFPLSGFFSKDEILFRAFLANKAVWAIAVVTAFMTAFYMFRLVSMTFFGTYRGPAWETTGHGAVAVAAAHGVKHPTDPHAHGQAHKTDHEVSHGPADHPQHAKDDDAHGHGHGPWHGPHESPKVMTVPLQVLALGAIVAGFFGVPAALGGNNAIEHFLEPSFTAEHRVEAAAATGAAAEPAAAAAAAEHGEGEAHVSRGVELGLMAFSLIVAITGIALAYRFYVTHPDISESLAERFAGAHRTLSNKYYVDELYGATVISGTFSAARNLWTVDRNVVDGAVNGAGWVTVISSWLSGLTDKSVVDGLVNLVGWIVQESSQGFRRLQTGPRAELRDGHAAWRLRVRDDVLVCEMRTLNAEHAKHAEKRYCPRPLRAPRSDVFMSHYLSIILFTPLVGAALLLFVNKENGNAIRWIANVFAFLGFAVSIPLWFWYNPGNAEFQFIERAPWIPSVGAEYFLGVDGLTVLLILLTTMMGSIATLSSWTAIEERLKEYDIFLLVLQTGMLGAFMALDFLLFFLFWEVMLVPMYFLIGIWGSANRLYSAIKFFLYTLVGSVVMLLGILALYFYNHSVTGVYTFDVTQFHRLNVPFNLQWWVFLAFFLGFAIKVPMFPFHTWLPDAHTDAPTAGSVILAAVLLKMGTYGFLRFSLPILPEASRHFVPMMVLLSIIGIVYGALVALAQKDWKRLVAYSSVSHMAMVMLGMFALNPVGITGSIVQQLNHGISTGALFLLVGVVYERRHTREISEYGGLSKVMPVYAAIFLIMTMSSIGLPTLNGFIGEFLILQGVFVASKMWAAFAASGVVLGAAYMLYLLSAHDVRESGKPEERAVVGSQPARVRDVCAAARARGLDRHLSGAVPAPSGNVGPSHRVAGEPAVQSEVRGQLRSDADARARGGNGRHQSCREVPDCRAVRCQRESVATELREPGEPS